MDYELDTNAAKQADSVNSRIDQTGKYFGEFLRAEPVTSKKGTEGVDFSFKSDTGSSADYLTIWTHNGEGKKLHGFNTLMAIMTCLKVKTLSASPGDVEKYDQELKKRIKVSVPLFKELIGKPIGLLLQMEEYSKSAGGTAWKPSIYGVFDKDEFTASEILNRAKQPETLAKIVQTLKDKPLKNSPSSAQNEQQFESSGDFGDDIPW